MDAPKEPSQKLKGWRLMRTSPTQKIDDLPVTPRAEVPLNRSPPRTVKSSKRKRPTAESSNIGLPENLISLSPRLKNARSTTRDSIFDVYIDTPEVAQDRTSILPTTQMSPSKLTRRVSVHDRSIRKKENASQTSKAQSRGGAYTRRSTVHHPHSLHKSLLQDQTTNTNTGHPQPSPETDAVAGYDAKNGPHSSIDSSLPRVPPLQFVRASRSRNTMTITPHHPPSSLRQHFSPIPNWFSSGSHRSSKSPRHQSRAVFRSVSFLADLTFEERLLVPSQGRFSPQAFSTPSAGRRKRLASLVNLSHPSARDSIMDSDHETPTAKSRKSHRMTDTLPTDSLFSSRHLSTDLALPGQVNANTIAGTKSRVSIATGSIQVSANKSLSDMSLASLAAPTFMVTSVSIDGNHTPSSDLLPRSADVSPFHTLSDQSISAPRQVKHPVMQGQRVDQGSENQDSLFSTTINNRTSRSRVTFALSPKSGDVLADHYGNSISIALSKRTTLKSVLSKPSSKADTAHGLERPCEDPVPMAVSEGIDMMLDPVPQQDLSTVDIDARFSEPLEEEINPDQLDFLPRRDSHPGLWTPIRKSTYDKFLNRNLTPSDEENDPLLLVSRPRVQFLSENDYAAWASERKTRITTDSSPVCVEVAREWERGILYDDSVSDQDSDT